MAGGQLARLVDGQAPLELGPALGTARLGPREPALERVVAHASAAAQVCFRGGDPTEALALARLACQTVGREEYAALLAVADDVLARAQQHVALAVTDHWAAVPGALLAQALCGTPEVGAPAPPP